MRPLVGDSLLAAWDQGFYEHDLARALTLLSLALPGNDRRSLAELPISERNRLLLHLHELTFGPLLAALAACSRCAARFEFSVPVRSLLDGAAGQPGAEIAEWFEGGVARRMRRASSIDLLALRNVHDRREAQEALLARCLDTEVEATDETSPRGDEVTAAFDALHAPAEIRFAIECCECAEVQTLDLDIARFLWLEVRNAAQLLLHDVRDLAAAFGWSEAAIVGMTPWRRDAYLQLANT